MSRRRRASVQRGQLNTRAEREQTRLLARDLQAQLRRAPRDAGALREQLDAIRREQARDRELSARRPQKESP